MNSSPVSEEERLSLERHFELIRRELEKEDYVLGEDR